MVDSTLIQHRKLEKAQQLQQQPLFGKYRLKWRQCHLFVSLKEHDQSPSQPTIESEQWLVECLKHSRVRLVRLDPNLGEARINLWAIACEQAALSTYLELPSICKPKTKNSLLNWGLIRAFNFSAATLLLLALSPVILILVLLIRLDSPEPILLWQWGVNYRGKLFRIFKFRPTGEIKDNPRFTWLGRWLHKYSLDELPQLFNVLRGEISLTEPSFCSLSFLFRNQL